jgi:hypothetical protein
MDERNESQVGDLALADSTRPGCVVSARGDIELAAHELHLEAFEGVLRGNEVELHLFCCAKNAAAYSTGHRNTTTSDSWLKEVVTNAGSQARLVSRRKS